MTNLPIPAGQGLPENLAGHWDTAGGRDMAIQALNDRHMDASRERISDFALANAVFLSPGIANLTDAKERIRWLSAKLAILTSAPDTRSADVPVDEAAIIDLINVITDLDAANALDKAVVEVERHIQAMIHAKPVASQSGGDALREALGKSCSYTIEPGDTLPGVRLTFHNHADRGAFIEAHIAALSHPTTTAIKQGLTS